MEQCNREEGGNGFAVRSEWIPIAPSYEAGNDPSKHKGKGPGADHTLVPQRELGSLIYKVELMFHEWNRNRKKTQVLKLNSIVKNLSLAPS